MSKDSVPSFSSTASSIQKEAVTSDDTKSVIGDEYILVRKAREAAKVKTIESNVKDSGVLPQPPLIRAGRTSMSGRPSGMKLKPLKTRLSFSFSQNSAANTAQTAVVSLIPSNSSEFSAWAGLYDEIRSLGGMVEFNASSQATGVGQAFGSTLLGGLAFDPLNSGTYGSVAALREASQSTLFQLAVSSVNAQVGTSGSGQTIASKNGLMVFKFKTPKGLPAVNTAASTVVSGQWASTTDASDIAGYIKPYIPAQGTGIISSLYGVVTLDVEFRSRS